MLARMKTGEPSSGVPPVNIGFGLVQAPDGKHMINCMIGHGLVQQGFAMFPAQWQELLESMPKLIADLSDQARRANLGLQVTSKMPTKGLNDVR